MTNKILNVKDIKMNAYNSVSRRLRRKLAYKATFNS